MSALAAPAAHPHPLARAVPDAPRVLVVTDTYAPAVNGVVRSIVAAKEAFERNGHPLDVIAPGTRAVARAHPEPRVSWLPAMETRVYPGLHIGLAPVRARHLDGFGVVHVQTPGPLGVSAARAARAAGIPYVYTYHTRFDRLIAHLASSAAARRAASAIAARVESRLIRHAARVIAPSRAIADELAREHRVEADVAPTGVDVARFHPPHARRCDAPTFLHVGRLSPEKNLDAILRALPHVLQAEPRATLRVVGDGPSASRARRLADALGVAPATRFLGHVDDARLALEYQHADVYVSASTFETQGLTVLEALACGTPAALAACDVFQPVVDAGAATAFDPEAPRAVAAAMLEARAQRPRLARAALRVARAHSTAAFAARLQHIYASAARGACRA